MHSSTRNDHRNLAEEQLASTAAAVRDAICRAAPEGCLRRVEVDPDAVEVLTRYGWLRVSAKPGMDCVHLFTRFQVPCLPKLGDLDVNVSGKWNHRLSSGEADACAKAVTLFAGIWPRGEHSIAEAEFLGAVGDLLQFIESARWDRHVFQEAAQQWAAKHKALPLRRDCGSLSTDGRSYHICCASCGTDYSDKAAQAFWQLAGSFFFSGDRTIARAQ